MGGTEERSKDGRKGAKEGRNEGGRKEGTYHYLARYLAIHLLCVCLFTPFVFVFFHRSPAIFYLLPLGRVSLLFLFFLLAGQLSSSFCCIICVLFLSTPLFSSSFLLFIDQILILIDLF